MTDFFILAVAVFAVVVLARLATHRWEPLDPEERETDG